MSELSQFLPDYMLPSALVMMESFPVTVNGKLDKETLKMIVSHFNQTLTI